MTLHFITTLNPHTHIFHEVHNQEDDCPATLPHVLLLWPRCPHDVHVVVGWDSCQSISVREGYLELPEYTDLATVTNLPNLSRVKLVSYRTHICYFDVFMVQLILFFFLGCRIGEIMCAKWIRIPIIGVEGKWMLQNYI